MFIQDGSALWISVLLLRLSNNAMWKLFQPESFGVLHFGLYYRGPYNYLYRFGGSLSEL